jgi:thiol:disulfide interchange protein DsbD
VIAKRSCRALGRALLTAALAAGPARELRSAEAPSRAELLADVAALQPGQGFTLGVRIALDKGWHTYWANPGDAGMAPELDWSLPAGVSPDGPLLYPVPTRFADGELISFGYADEVMLLQQFKLSDRASAGDTLAIRLRIHWLICKELCLPASATLQRALPVRAQGTAAPPAEAARFAEARRRLPVAAPRWQWRATAGRRQVTLCATPPPDFAPRAMEAALFFPLQSEVVTYAPVAWRRQRDRHCLAMRRFDSGAKPPPRLRGVLAWPPDAQGNLMAVAVDTPLNEE